MFNSLKNTKETLKKEIEILNTNYKELNLEINELQQNKNNLLKEIQSYIEKKNILDIEIKQREKFTIEAELKYIDFMQGFDFESYICELLLKLGYKAVVTKSSNDYGGDVIAEKDDIKYAIQCKRYNEKVSAKPLGEVLRAKGNYQCDKAIVFTNNYFTENAIVEAKNCDIELWDRDTLIQLLYKKFDFDISHLNIPEKDKNVEDNNADMDYDPLLKDSVDLCFEFGQVSASMLQRRFKIGYSRAGRIVDQMEEKGIISGYEGSNPRKVLISKEEWERIKDAF